MKNNLIKGQAIPFTQSNIDTDAIIPTPIPKPFCAPSSMYCDVDKNEAIPDNAVIVIDGPNMRKFIFS